MVLLKNRPKSAMWTLSKLQTQEALKRAPGPCSLYPINNSRYIVLVPHRPLPDVLVTYSLKEERRGNKCMSLCVCLCVQILMAPLRQMRPSSAQLEGARSSGHSLERLGLVMQVQHNMQLQTHVCLDTKFIQDPINKTLACFCRVL